MKRFLAIIVGLGTTALLMLAAWIYFFANSSLPLVKSPFEFAVRPGATLKSLSRQLADAGLLPDGQTLWLLGRACCFTAARRFVTSARSVFVFASRRASTSAVRFSSVCFFAASNDSRFALASAVSTIYSNALRLS